MEFINSYPQNKQNLDIKTQRSLKKVTWIEEQVGYSPGHPSSMLSYRVTRRNNHMTIYKQTWLKYDIVNMKTNIQDKQQSDYYVIKKE